MGRKSKLPAVKPSISPVVDQDYVESRRVCLPPIPNAPLVTTVQGRPGELRVRPGTGLHQKTNPFIGSYLPRPPTPGLRRQVAYLNSDSQMPSVHNRDMATRRCPITSQIDLSLPRISDLPRNNLRLLRRQQMPQNAAHFGETNVQLSPPNAPSILPPIMADLTIQGQRIPTPIVRSPCEGMEDPFSDFSGRRNSPVFTSRPALGQTEIPPLNLRGLGSSCYRSPRVLTPRDIATPDNRANSLCPSSIPKLPSVKKHKKRAFRDDHL